MMKATLEETVKERKSLEEAYQKQQNELLNVNLFLFNNQIIFETFFVGKICSYLSLSLFFSLLRANNQFVFFSVDTRA